MPMPNAYKTLQEMSSVPSEKDRFNAWLELKDVVPFLVADAQQDDVVVYAAVRHAFMHAVMVPASLLNPPDADDLMGWNSNAHSSWGVSTTFSEPPSARISPPLESNGSKTLEQGEQLVFARTFEGRVGDKSYFEVLQQFLHIFELHFLAERSAYCRLDRHGDIEEVIRIIASPKDAENGGIVVTFRRDLLEEYGALTDSLVVRMFDVTRFRLSHFSGWSDQAPTPTEKGDVLYHSLIVPGYASYMRGCQIVRPLTPKATLIKRLTSGPSNAEERDHASFVAYDFKNGMIKQISCAPGETANYFTVSDLPFEMSPAFFRPEVLLKYKADADKYRLQERSISCRGAWHLETYDINESGQVHTYLVYLRRLPYEEQLYWKAYNEKPKASISERAMKTDFEGSWAFDYDPLTSLKEALSDLAQQRVPWWKLRSEDLLDLAHYPVTTSPDEWSNELLQLDKLIVEGFEEKWLRKKAQSLGRTPGTELRSLKLVEECLVALGFDEERAGTIVAPLREVHNLRSKLKGHASGDEATLIKKKVLASHGSYKAHFRALCAECDESVRAVVEALAKLK